MFQNFHNEYVVSGRRGSRGLASAPLATPAELSARIVRPAARANRARAGFMGRVIAFAQGLALRAVSGGRTESVGTLPREQSSGPRAA